MKNIPSNNFFNGLPSIACKEQSLLYNLLPAALSNVPFHQDTAAITRMVADGFPFHLAVHRVSPVMTAPAEYTQAHWHSEHDEINIILSENQLVYKIQLGEETFSVTNNAAVWVPKGVLHAANLLEGSGFFITIRI